MIRRKRLALSKKLVYDTWRKEDYMNKSMEYLNKLLNDIRSIKEVTNVERVIR